MLLFPVSEANSPLSIKLTPQLKAFDIKQKRLPNGSLFDYEVVYAT